jgi:hypothetical protein
MWNHCREGHGPRFSLTSTLTPYTTTTNTNLERAFTVDFAAGSGAGAEIANSVPEPGSLLLFRRRRRGFRAAEVLPGGEGSVSLRAASV